MPPFPPPPSRKSPNCLHWTNQLMLLWTVQSGSVQLTTTTKTFQLQKRDFAHRPLPQHRDNPLDHLTDQNFLVFYTICSVCVSHWGWLLTFFNGSKPSPVLHDACVTAQRLYTLFYGKTCLCMHSTKMQVPDNVTLLRFNIVKILKNLILHCNRLGLLVALKYNRAAHRLDSSMDWTG